MEPICIILQIIYLLLFPIKKRQKKIRKDKKEDLRVVIHKQTENHITTSVIKLLQKVVVAKTMSHS